MKIVDAMRDALPGVEFTSVPRNLFDVKRGSMELRRMCTPECLSVLDMHEEKYYCIAAAAALVSFTEANLSSVFANQSTKVEFHTFGKSIMIGELLRGSLLVKLSRHLTTDYKLRLSTFSFSNVRTPTSKQSELAWALDVTQVFQIFSGPTAKRSAYRK
jgi:hypothetical protein